MKRLLLVLAIFVFGAVAPAVQAQPYPNKLIRIIVPYPPGGATDILARVLAEKMTPMLGQIVIVENRAGASGNIGFGYVAKAEPDGYTLLMGTANITIAPAFSDNLSYNVLTDFAPVATVVSSQNLLVIRPELPAKNLKELITYIKANPGKLNYGSSGIGTPLLSIELMKSLAGLDIVHVPYKCDTPALADLMSGSIDIYCSTIIAEVPYVKVGKLRALGVTSKQRAASLPEIPTIEEAGIRGYELASWYGILAPAGTPKEIVDRLNAEVRKLVDTAEVQKQIHNEGGDPLTSTPAEYAADIDKEETKWGGLVKKLGLKVE
jgi:tripartite-type tricarboxylate transporter receptor subunit TctC